MPVLRIAVHPMGLHPIEAVKGWHKHIGDGMSLDAILAEGEVLNLCGQPPGKHALWSAIRRVKQMSHADIFPTSNYAKCGRKQILSNAQQQSIVQFVKAWRHKRFCTARYIREELRLKASQRTICRVLNAHGYHWKPVPRIEGFSKLQLSKRKAFVDKYISRPVSWWQAHMSMVLDGVTLTMAPKPLNGRQKHAAQRLSSMWMRNGERLNNDIHTFNRYGVQIGTKVPLWGGFSGNGHFTLRMWTAKPKMTKAEWEVKIPMVKAAVDDAYGDDVAARPWVWHDNERFLLCPETYKANGLTLVRFPPCSGDLNPIETVWAWLRRDLAIRERDDLAAGRYLTPRRYRLRCAQILQSYAVPKAGDSHSRLQKLVRGMPRRLQSCRANRYGKCGK